MNLDKKELEDEGDYPQKLVEIRSLFNIEMAKYNEVFENFYLLKFLDLLRFY